MQTNYYIYGERPIIEEVNDNYDVYYAYQWDTGEFKEDMTYGTKVSNDPSGDLRKMTKEEFDTYVKNLKKEKGLN